MPTQSYLATNIFDTDGIRTDWAFSFAGASPESNTQPYLFPEDVRALEMYTAVSGAPAVAERSVRIDPLRPNVAIVVGPAIAAGRRVRIYRKTEIRFPLVDYRDRQSVSEADLDLANRQAIFVAQETLDAARDNLLQDLHGNYDALGRRVVNVADGQDPTDAINLRQLRRSIRVGDMELPVLPGASSRANKLLGFDSYGRPEAMLAASGSATELEQSLADAQDGTKGANKIGYRDLIAGTFPGTVADIIRALPVSVMRFIPQSEHAGIYDGSSQKDYTQYIQRAIDSIAVGGELTFPAVTLRHTGLVISTARNPKLTGAGWRTRLLNINSTGGHALWVKGETIDNRTYGLDVSCMTIEGNVNSGDGVRLDRLGWYDVGTLKASVATFDRVQILNNGGNGVQCGRSSTEGAGNSINFIGCYISGNGRTGVVGIGQTNMISVIGCGITRNGVDGVELNQVASTNTVTQNFIADNVRYGVYTFRCEQPMITHNGFNRNMQGALALSGAPVDSIKYTEAGMIFANLFGDNGRSSASHREVSIYASRGINIIGNYFYGTRQKTMIYLSDYAEGIMMSGNHFKDLTTEVKLEIKPGALNLSYTFDDDLDVSLIRNIISNKALQYILPSISTLMQTRSSLDDSSPRFRISGDGSMSWGSGNAPSDVSMRRVTPGSLTVTGGMQADTLMVADGITTPNAAGGYARIFVDSADGKLKIRFSSGVVRTFQVT